MKRHGMYKTRLYGVWGHMIQRCTNEHDPKYKDYGKRGISVCKEWRNDFLNFYNWAMDNGYADNLTIDRIDVNGNYEPDNCRWATPKVQANNTRRNLKYEYNGEKLTLSQWSEKTGIPYKTLHRRLKNGWSVEKTLTVKENPLLTTITYKGKTQTIADWAKDYGIEYHKLKQRIRKYHWTIERALNTP